MLTYPYAYGVFELTAWLLDPFGGTHRAANHTKTMASRIVPALLNSIPSIIIAYYLDDDVQVKTRYGQLLWDSLFASSIPIVLACVFYQWFFYWIPYVMGQASGVHHLAKRIDAELERGQVPRVVPRFGHSSVVPALEHTIEQPLGLLNVYQFTKTIVEKQVRLDSSWLVKGLFIFWLLIVIFLPFDLAQEPNKPKGRPAPAALIVSITIAVLSGFLGSHLHVFRF